MPEQPGSLTPEERELFRRELLSSLHCALPGIVTAFDPATQTVTVQPAMRSRLSGSSRTGTVSSASSGLGSAAISTDTTDTLLLPLIHDVPVFFPGSRRAAMTFPIEPGDECLLIFADSAIDRWFETGEAEAPDSARHHDLSDAFAFVGFRSRPNALPEFPDEPSFFGR